MNIKRVSLLLCLAAVALRSYGQQTSSQGQGTITYHPATPIDPVPPAPPIVPMPLVMPLFLDGNHFSSLLTLVNNSTATTYADVTVRGLDGSSIVTRRVNFTPHSQQQVPIGELLETKNSSVTGGSILIKQSSALMGPSIAGVLSMTYQGPGDPNYIDEEPSVLSTTGSQTLQGVSDRGDGSPYISISSYSTVAQHVKISCFGEHGVLGTSQIDLAPNETLITEGCSSQNSPVDDIDVTMQHLERSVHEPLGMRLTSDAAPGSFAAFGLVPHKKGADRFLSNILFSDPTSATSSKIIFVGVPAGPSSLLPDGIYTPHINIANFSTKSLKVNVTYAYTSGGNPEVHEVVSASLEPRSSREFVLSGSAGDPELENSFVITGDAAPGQFAAKVISASDSVLHEVELQAKDEHDASNSGMHPWSIENSTESTLLLFNHSAKTQHFDLSIFTGGVGWQKTYDLAPMQTKEISFRELIDDQVTDGQGNALPRTAERGEVNWMVVDPNNGTGRLLQSDKARGMARNFSCGYSGLLCGNNFDQLLEDLADDLTGDFGSIVPITCTSGQPQFCSGQQTGTGGSFSYSWNSGTPSVASVSGSSVSQNVNLLGVSGGNSTIAGRAYSQSCSTGGSGPVAVQVPTALRVVQTTYNAANSCPAGQAGWYRQVNRAVIDQNSMDIKVENQSVGETVTVNPGQNGLNIGSIATHTGITDSSGQYPDNFYICSPLCPGSGTTTATQTNSDMFQSSSTVYTLTNSTIQYGCTYVKINGALTP